LLPNETDKKRHAMKLPRRDFLRFAAGAAVLPVVPRVAKAGTYPSRPVHIIVGFPAGGVGDTVTRLTGQWLSDHLGQPFIIENRPGASGSIGTEAVVRAAPDGYTLLATQTSDAINATLNQKLSFIFVRDIAPVAGLVLVPNVLLVHPSIPVKTVSEFVAYAKANPGKLNMASAGNGQPSHVAGELFKLMTGIEMVHVPYRGGAPALTDLIAGHVQVIFVALPAAIGHIRAGKLRPLAVTTTTRVDVLPDVPTVDETVPGYQASGWQGVGAPRGTPIDIVDKLNRVINGGLADQGIKARLSDLGGTVLSGSSADFAKFVVEETARWARVIKLADIKPE
jgi:tripartite-type tricarboxylate transporter receptor subunit TctC